MILLAFRKFAAGLLALRVCLAAGFAALVCDAPEYDFGQVDESAVIEHAFTVRNDGTEPVRIKRVSGSCGCTPAELAQKTILPGAEAAVKVKFFCAGRRGGQRKSIRIELDDPDQPLLRLWLVGDVQVELGLSERYLNFGQIAPDRPSEKTVRLVSQRPGVRLTDVEADSPYLAVALFPDGDERGEGFVVRTVCPVPTGYLRANITARTDHPTRRGLTLPVMAFVQGEVVVLPTRIALRKAVQGQLKRSLYVRPGSVRNYKLIGVDVPSPEIEVKTTLTGEGLYRIDLYNLRATDALDGTAVVIRTDLEEMREIDVPITIIP